jgi:hypothetical protein
MKRIDNIKGMLKERDRTFRNKMCQMKRNYYLTFGKKGRVRKVKRFVLSESLVIPDKTDRSVKSGATSAGLYRRSHCTADRHRNVLKPDMSHSTYVHLNCLLIHADVTPQNPQMNFYKIKICKLCISFDKINL